MLGRPACVNARREGAVGGGLLAWTGPLPDRQRHRAPGPSRGWDSGDWGGEGWWYRWQRGALGPGIVGIHELLDGGAVEVGLVDVGTDDESVTENAAVTEVRGVVGDGIGVVVAGGVEPGPEGVGHFDEVLAAEAGGDHPGGAPLVVSDVGIDAVVETVVDGERVVGGGGVMQWIHGRCGALFCHAACRPRRSPVDPRFRELTGVDGGVQERRATSFAS